MKKILCFLLMLFSLTISAQKDVTKFLGIPVDGNKEEMKQKLKAIGFRYDSQYDFFKGEFNGRDVQVYIGTNHNKVWRIMVCDKNTCGEGEIKIRFNNLCRQFEKNIKYINATMEDYTLPQKEKISYEMLVNKKRYDACYYQMADLSSVDTLEIQRRVQETLLREYTQEEIDNPSEELQDRIESLSRSATMDIVLEMTFKKMVWFTICENYGQYYITMFYDNEYNRPDGEDL